MGRKREFANFHWQGEVPDPSSLETFEKSKLNWQQRTIRQGQKTAAYYHALIELRKKYPIFQPQANRQIKNVSNQESVLFIQKQNRAVEAAIIANTLNQVVTYDFPFDNGTYTKVLDSADFIFNGRGPTLPTLAAKGDENMISAFNFAVFIKEPPQGVEPID